MGLPKEVKDTRDCAESVEGEHSQGDSETDVPGGRPEPEERLVYTLVACAGPSALRAPNDAESDPCGTN